MERFKSTILLMFVVLGLLTPIAGAKSVGIQLREALYQEEVSGDLDAAIDIYRKVIDTAAENRRYAAQAHYRLGMCYIKKGEKQKAIGHFETILKDYSDQGSTVSKAKKELAKIKPQTEGIPPFFNNPIFLNQIIPVIYDMHLEARNEAKEKGLHSNTHIYGVDQNFTRYSGGIATLENNSSKDWTKDVHLMNASGSDIGFYDENGIKIDVKLKKRNLNISGKYSYSFDPDRPIAPGEMRSLAWGFGTQKMPLVSDNRYTMQMHNHFGDKVLENFFLIMPSNIKIYNSSSDHKIKKTIAGHDIYLFQRNVPPATTNRVDLTLGIADNLSGDGFHLDDSLYAKLPSNVINYIGGIYGGVCAKAGVKQLYSNSHIYYVDEYFILRGGGMGYYFNQTGQPVSGKVRLSGTTRPNQTLYDTSGREMDFDIVKDENRIGFYNVYWTPEEPVPPGQFFSFGWSMHGSKKLDSVNDSQRYALRMNNKFGDKVFETFFLVVPNSISIATQTEDYTDKQTVGDFDVYHWSKELPPNTSNTVDLELTQPNGAAITGTTSPAYTQKSVNDIQADGTIKGKVTVTKVNKSSQSKNSYGFINSDFVHITKMYDENDVELKFTETHEKNHYRYKVELNEPWNPGETQRHTHESLIYGLVTPVEGLENVYQYYMRHWPSTSVATKRIETYLLPEGAEIISMVPPNMKQKTVRGRIMLTHEETIKTGTSITTSFQYRLTGTHIEYKDISEEQVEKIVRNAVQVISTCAEGDPKINNALKTLKPIEPALVLKYINKQLDSKSATKRRSAIYIAWRGGFKDISLVEQKLIELCSHEENITRGMAAIALGEGQAASSFDILADMTLNDKDGYARRCGAYALGLIGDKKALPTLEKALNDSDAMVKANAEAAITMLKDLKDK